MAKTKASKLKELKVYAHEMAIESDQRYGMEDDDLWCVTKLFALRRNVADDELTLKDLKVIRSYVDQVYTQGKENEIDSTAEARG